MLAMLSAGLACDRDAVPGREPGAVFRGVLLNRPIEKPDFTFTDTNGEPYNFRLATAGKVALLFFGYTHCPDVCPLHAANVAAVLKQMPFEERARIQFVFVTTDPERDTPARLKQWLGSFDPSFVGLVGPPSELARVQREVGVPLPQKEVPANADSANYLVGHGAQVLAFGLDNFARVEYPFGVRQEDWAHDLPRLARAEVPGTPGAPSTSTTTAINPAPRAAGATDGPTIRVETALMPAPLTTSEAAVYLIIRNNGVEDTLTSVSSPDAQGAMVHRTVNSGGSSRMSAINTLPIPAGGTLELLPGATHVMLTNLSRRPTAGESFPLKLHFAKAGDYVLAPLVVRYADVDSALKRAR
ncbi:MAG: SCO family protein [Gemmatimonadaceae bacterium]